jgi:hypothetical protein
MTTVVIQSLMLLMSAGFFLSLFGKAMGLPPWTEEAGLIFGGACAVIGLVLQRLAKKSETRVPTISPRQRLRRRWMFIILGAVVTLSAPFWLPAANVPLPLRYRLLVGIMTFALVTALVIIATRDRTQV